jgi:hypothetical protein
MEKYLFADGTGGVKEAHSKEELDQLIQAAPKKELVRIWVFNTPEWLSYSDFSKSRNGHTKKERPAAVVERKLPVKSLAGKQWLKKFLFFSFTGSAIFLVYNFTRIEWKKAAPVRVIAGRPANSPLINTDSLVQVIEFTRGQKVDRTTRTNLRIRNGWPDRVLLRVDSDRDTSSAGTRFYNTEVTIDNTTGYTIDQAVVKLSIWKKGSLNTSDTLVFNNVGYAFPSRRIMTNNYKGDSISVSFQTIKAKSFNFCYSADKTSNYGNVNDRWFCRE